FRQVRSPESERFNFLAHCVQCGCELAKGTALEVRLEWISTSAQELLDPVEEANQLLAVMIRHDDMNSGGKPLFRTCSLFKSARNRTSQEEGLAPARYQPFGDN